VPLVTLGVGQSDQLPSASPCSCSAYLVHLYYSGFCAAASPAGIEVGGGDSGDTGTAEVPVSAGRGGRARKYRRSTRPSHPFSRSFARCASQHPFLSTIHPPRPPAEWLMHGLFPISGWDSERPSQRPRPRRLPRRTLLRLAASGVGAGRGLALRASSSGVAEPTTVRRRGLSWIPGSGRQ
jgi:hypothetical protein